MTLEGKQLIGQQAVTSDGKPIHAVDPATGETLSPGYPAGGQAEVEQACALAWAAFETYRETGLEARATFLETVAAEIEAIGDELIERAMAESGPGGPEGEHRTARPVGPAGCGRTGPESRWHGRRPGSGRKHREAWRHPSAGAGLASF